MVILNWWQAIQNVMSEKVRYTTGKEKAGHMRRNQFVSQQQKDHS